ncbi:hypothetical protein OUZ56_030752 [Daphnia magna]|uniref:Uncharacterized protein n=1 Tax=Daphnia magna TaxID=35525 RepID=A0ABQ9ZS97_9CRUS|nr:hypothetical protein OUZ56_030752 [Daphnia magna]
MFVILDGNKSHWISIVQQPKNIRFENEVKALTKYQKHETRRRLSSTWRDCGHHPTLIYSKDPNLHRFPLGALYVHFHSLTGGRLSVFR